MSLLGQIKRWELVICEVCVNGLDPWGPSGTDNENIENLPPNFNNIFL